MDDFGVEVDHPSPQPPSHKRKRSSPEWQAHPVSPLSALSSNDDSYDPSTLFLLRYGRHADQYLKQEATRGTPDIAAIIGDNRAFVQVAQMTADQAISTTKTSRSLSQHQSEKSPVRITDIHQSVLGTLTSWASRAGKGCKRCTLTDFVGCDDQDAVREKKIQYPTRVSTVAQLISKLPSPYACVQRSNMVIDVATSALSFWEELSFAPSCGSKDITAFCLYPTGRDIGEEVHTFLSMIKGAYLNCRLGMHNLGSHAEFNSFIPIPTLPHELQVRACESFGSRLGKARLQGHNTVIYMVDSSDDEKSLPLLCAAFLKLFNAYMKAVKDERIDNPNDLVLQIVPSSLIFSDLELVLPSPTDYRRLAFELYNRCGPSENEKDRKRSQFISAPSMRLAKAIPKNIDFRLTPDNPAFSLQSDNCLHIAYTWTPGSDWLCASWTDNLGILSWNACYCFGDAQKNFWQSLSEIAHEIWETTLEMLQPRNGRWRLLICKDGAVYKHELDGEYCLLEVPRLTNGSAWQRVVTGSTRFSVLPTLLTVEASPLLDLHVQQPEMKGSELLFGSWETPESTPQPSVPSPDISGIGSTPGVQVNTPPPATAFGDHDAEARLVDVTDETWGVVVNRHGDDVCMPSEFSPAVASGYLLKRVGPRDEDGVVRMGVNIVLGQKPHRPLLKAVLGMYRNLGLLARIRGIADSLTGVEPFHIAAVRKAAAAVSIMHYGETGAHGQQD